MGTNSLIRAIIRFRSRRGDARLFISDNFKTFKSSDLERYLERGGEGFMNVWLKLLKPPYTKLLENQNLSNYQMRILNSINAN